MADNEEMDLDDIRNRVANLNQEAKSLTHMGRKRALGEIVKLMNDFELTLQDIERVATKPAQMLRSSTFGRAKYEDPDTGKTWTGRGKAPKWLLEKEASGISRETLLIKNSKE